MTSDSLVSSFRASMRDLCHPRPRGRYLEIRSRKPAMQETFVHRPIDKAAKPPPSCLLLRKVRPQHHEAIQLPSLYFAVRSAVFAPMREIRSSGESTT